MKLTYEIQKPRFNYNLDVPTEYSFYQKQHPEFNDTQIFNLIYEDYLSGEISGEIYSAFATGDELLDFAVALTMSKEEFMQRIQKEMEKYRKKTY